MTCQQGCYFALHQSLSRVALRDGCRRRACALQGISSTPGLPLPPQLCQSKMSPDTTRPGGGKSSLDEKHCHKQIGLLFPPSL